MTKKTLFSILSVILISFCSFAQTTQTISTPGAGTFYVPCDVTSITIEAWGAGGAGGGSNRNGRHGGGGGGGGYTTDVFTVTPGQAINYTIGAGGIGGTGNGQDGGDTNILTLTANGGNGGNRGIPPGGNGGAGGGSSGGNTNTDGTNGQDGNGSIGGNGGNGANPNGGIGGNGVHNGSGFNGTTPGGGGGGAEATTFLIIFTVAENGGDGGNGQIRFTYTTNDTYCQPSFTGNRPITNVTFDNINNTTTNTLGGSSLESFCDLATVQQGSTTPISVKGRTNGNNTYFVTVFIDWNQNSIYENNATERYDIGTITNSTGIDNVTLNNSITAPLTATLGLTRMRVIMKFNSYVTGSCQSGSFGQAEDYSINVTPTLPCSAPTVQPQAPLSLTATGTSISGTFTYSNPAVDNYLVVMNTSGVQPTPNNGTTYTSFPNPGNNTVGAGNIVIDTDDDNIFTAAGLTTNTTYYFYVFSYNSNCTGGPLYNTANPLNASTTTTNNTYCTPSANNTNYYINNVRFLGTLQEAEHLNSGRATNGYGDYTNRSPKCEQAQGEGINVFVEARDQNYRGRFRAWVDWDRNGVFDNPGELVYSSGGTNILSTTFGFVIPAGQAVGDYRIRIRIKYGANPGPCGYLSRSETEDYIFTVVPSCNAIITSVTDGENCGPGQVSLSASGSANTASYNWYTTETGGTADPAQHSNTFLTPNIIATTTYYVAAVSTNSCESLVRQPVIATISPITDLEFTPTSPEVCGEDNVIEVSASGNSELVYLINEDFEGSGLGSFVNIENNASNNATNWTNRQSTLQFPVAGPYADIWLPAISSGINNNNFALAIYDISGTHHNSLTSSTNPSTADFLDLTLTFDLYYSRYEIDNVNVGDDYVSVQVATNAAGNNWTELNRYVTDIGIGTRFEKQTFDLSNYIDNPAETNIRVRIRYYGSYVDGAAVDNIKIFGNRPLTTTAFNWTSNIPVDVFTDLAATISYTPNTPIAGPIYVKPDYNSGQLEDDEFEFTAQATLANGCLTSEKIIIQNKTKVWIGNRNGSLDWNNANNWAPSGIPTIDNCVIIPSNCKIPNGPPLPPSINYNAYAKNLTIKSTGNLELLTTQNLIVKEAINIDNNGVFDIQDNASLLQIENFSNTGIAKIKRDTQPITRLDYTYWGSPVTESSNYKLNDLSPLTPTDRFFTWRPTINSGGAGDWLWMNPTTTDMKPGVGYAVLAPGNHTNDNSNPVVYPAEFVGTPENGTVNVNITMGTDANIGTSVFPGGPLVVAEDDQWNLIANPYPSAIDITDFLSYIDPNNPSIDNTAILDGTIYLWTHNSEPDAAYPDYFYGNYGINYTSDDYAKINYMGATTTYDQALSGGQFPTQFIASGQGFFILATNNGTAVFNNDMRVTSNNDNFFRQRSSNTSQNSTSSVSFEKHRLWLNLSNNNGGFSQILIGYAQGASLDWDRGLDGLAFGGNAVTFYSVIPDKILAIQGRPLPFTETDEVPLGFVATGQNSYTIGIDHLDAFFETQPIYLEDTYTGIVHDLKLNPYSFSSDAGRFNDRFILKYTDDTLGVSEFSNNLITIIAPQGNYIKVTSKNEPLNSIMVYDILGRTLIDRKDINITELTLNKRTLPSGTYIVKATLYNGKQKTQKVILKY
ncbi:GEVED domain-containing protein [Ichthyenterobacterium magnum]|uniref:Uncharacterized protein n=1 Tax=Ichthyenterobacterium magnum TaxID=1230530 RepID=A0A420DG33_9FLAO|nr:GEVED domain-containing protein [Ichthyenterobacterium magnum]RKE91991.1 hypothetical protein BXY80_2423 [Ichthyenterobacterium magnum]